MVSILVIAEWPLEHEYEALIPMWAYVSILVIAEWPLELCSFMVLRGLIDLFQSLL